MAESTKSSQCRKMVTADGVRSAQQLLVQLAPAGLTQRQAAAWAIETFKAICPQCAEDKMRDATM
jgi:hypothetical protein